MKEIMMAIFMACFEETIPNRYTVENLTEEQTSVLLGYADAKCQQRVEVYFNQKDEPQLGEQKDPLKNQI